MHMVWMAGRIFLKPIPPFLHLEPSVWSDNLLCRHDGWCSKDMYTDTDIDKDTHCRWSLWPWALGFLLSYTALISHESDFLIAQGEETAPEGDPVVGLEDACSQDARDQGYRRQDRCAVPLRRAPTGAPAQDLHALEAHLPPWIYARRSWQRYRAYFQDNLAWLASATIYIAVALTAMQVGLATSLAGKNAFQSAWYGLTIFSLGGPLVAAALIVLVLMCMFVYNWVEAVRYKNIRLPRWVP